MFNFSNDAIKGALSIFVPVAFVAHMSIWMFFPPEMLSDKIVGMLQSMLGLHGAWAGTIIGYYFNSSASSARKDEIIASAAPVVPKPQVPPNPPSIP